MAETTSKLPDFPGFAVRYDPSKNPFFQAIMVENLRILDSKEIGKSLLKQIGEASPKHRGQFPDGVNVMCTPYHINYTQSGFSRQGQFTGDGGFKVEGMKPSTAASHNLKNCPFHIAGSSFNKADDPSFNDKGRGTVCWMAFSNAQFITSKGETAQPFIVLAHELIHSLHCLTGTHNGSEEELMTSGIGKYSDLPMSENAFRKAFGLPPRVSY
ncbi:M91 family zinc metallopeptidase [Gemmatimonas sp. UBA7669]|uniref:M91 family zinc metallopeptidase n=1 Tax=Gemmatimonas sp. UBA7669 TaxID=1946568 RepID=UPI0025C6218D|nr:M91 family zinc metallopeptidase [Gemmatimonas sp. UBA7669]